MNKKILSGALAVGLLVTGGTNVFAAENHTPAQKASSIKPMSAAYTTVTASNNQVTLSINGLSNPFTSKYYNMVSWTTDGGQPDSTKSNILATKRAGDTTSITLSLDEVKRKLGTGTRIYGWAQAANGTWYTCGSDSISL
ncbi:hypothetical protein [Bacillus halotolerans]|uniref:hypothetical protein n=1 Tax=Bacillus halotolerans TaxID=260554 RepID=UPI00228107E2|nr:hypothetical protein [Bacillus halotolerans]MCY8475000.1 hypothetical protein [Bacillus halotolerans]